MRSLLSIPLLLLTLFNPINLSAQTDVEGVVLDSKTGEPLAHVFLHLEEMNRSATSDRNGFFRFQNVPPGAYYISLHRVGYKSHRLQLAFNGDQTRKEIEISMEPSGFAAPEVVITDERELAGGHLEHASVKVLGEDLRRELGITLSQTLQNMPGFSERSLGPAPGRPIVRGLDGERVVILKDGIGIGDVSTVATDHAVSIDPMSAKEIEIARGPAALAYSGNALGGVINVVKNLIPTSVPGSVRGIASLQGHTVNNQLSLSGQVLIPRGRTAINLDLTGNYGEDFAVPGGHITNTYIRNMNNAVGVGFIRPWGYFGGSASLYLSEYGIPPDPQGGHPNGVDIEMIKLQTHLKGEYIFRDSFLRSLEADAAFTGYYHRELESSGAVGTEYEQFIADISLSVHHRDALFFDSGHIGVSGKFLDYIVTGASTPASRQFSGAVYAIQERDIGPLHLELGNRVDFSAAVPETRRVSRLIGEIRPRTFAGVSSSVSAIYNFGTDWYIGSTAMLSYRPPTLEELYSEGPHLAAYTFEIGNPDLNGDRGLGKELFIRKRGRKLNFEVAGFRNYFSRYIFPRDTGRQSVRFPDLNDFQFTESEALFYGFESALEIGFGRFFSIGGNATYTIGNRRDAGTTEPLPLIPPFKGLAFAQFRSNKWMLRGQMRFAAEQARPAEFESSTSAYQVFDINAMYLFNSTGMLHSLTLSARNILDARYRNHLSVIKDIFPEPGRNVSLLYRLYF